MSMQIAELLYMFLLLLLVLFCLLHMDRTRDQGLLPLTLIRWTLLGPYLTNTCPTWAHSMGVCVAKYLPMCWSLTNAVEEECANE